MDVSRPTKRQRVASGDTLATTGEHGEKPQENGHLRLRQYDGKEKAAVQATTTVLKVKLVTENPLASKAGEINLATEAWIYACKKIGFNGGDITDRIRKTVSADLNIMGTDDEVACRY